MPALIALAYVSLLSLALLDNIRGPLYPEILHDLSLSATRGSFFFATVSLFAILGNWSSHHLLRRQSCMRWVAYSSWFLAFGFAGIALAPHLSVMLIGCALFGLAYGVLNVLQNVLVHEAAPAHRRRRLFNGLHAMYGMASLAAPLLASQLRDSGFNWRRSFLLVCVFPAAVGVWAFFFRHSEAEPTSAAPQEESAPRLQGVEWKHTAFFAFALGLYLWGELSISTRLPLWLRSERGFTPDQADDMLAAFFLTLLSGRLLFTSLSLKNFSNWTVLTASAALSAVVYMGALMWNPWLFVLVGFTMAPFYPVLMDQAGLHFRKKSSQALGAIIAGGSVSLVVMHIVIGMINDYAGLSTAMGLCACLLGLLALTLWLRPIAKPGRGLTA
ncbi:MAG: MFS transporter [Bdellovibrionales bacterium]|nr:MFS transporter [Bdellovibrionales bacterium]